MPEVERLVFGTAALGLPYGLARDGAFPKLMDTGTAGDLVRRALVSGVRTFDTAPAYGEAEARLGAFAGADAFVWTKVGRHTGLGSALASEVQNELDGSLSRLRRDRVDVLQWHNWTAGLERDDQFRSCWRALAARGRQVGMLGAATYGVDDALAAVDSGLFSIVQVEYNLLNQQVALRAAERAAKRNVTVAVRSVFLQGALTDDARTLPSLPSLVAGVSRARGLARAWGMSLTELALRAALDGPGVARVLVGIDRAEQLDEACRCARLGPLPSELLRGIRELDLSGDPAVDPRTW